MDKTKQKRIARWTAIPAAAVMVVVTIVLTADYVRDRWLTSAYETEVVELQEKVVQEFEFAATLHDVHKRQTDGTLKRQSRTKPLSIVLMIASALFLIGAKWYDSLRGGEPAPSLARIVAEKTPPGASGAAAARRGAREVAEAAVEPEIDLAFVDAVIAREGTSREAAIPILQAIQEHYRYLPDEALRRVCELTEISPAQIAGTSSFYAQFRRSPVGEHIVRICHGTACHVAGAREITEEVRRHLEIADGTDTDPQRLFTIDEVACLGCCSLAPVLMVDEHTAGRLTPATACDALWVAEEEMEEEKSA
ncbi:MAG: NAD(P)H-dependent oxidoreductase subunit E [bacterium]|nr:NAD(P)H-dependent oxidoreductase subunit E [bacterium]